VTLCSSSSPGWTLVERYQDQDTIPSGLGDYPITFTSEIRLLGQRPFQGQYLQKDGRDQRGPCRTQKIQTLDCRYKTTDVTLYRTGKAPGLEFTARWPQMTLKNISEWQNSEVRTIRVVSDVCPNPLQLSVRKFVPIPKDSLHKSWMDGSVKKYKETTPFAIADMKAALEDMKKFVDDNVYVCLTYFLDKRAAFIKDTYIFAWSHMMRAVSPPRR